VNSVIADSDARATTGVPKYPIGDRRNIVLLDPGLFFEGGHHATLARLLTAESRLRGEELRIFAGCRFHSEVPGVKAVNHFATSPYATIPPHDPETALRQFNQQFATDLSRLPIEMLRHADLALIPTVSSRIALGIAQWLESFGGTPPCRLAVIMMFPPGFGASERIRSAELAIYKEALKRYHRFAGESLSVLAETAPVAQIFERLGAPPIRPVDWPVTLPGDDAPFLTFDRTELPPLVTHLGYSKVERGAELIPGVIRRVLRERPVTRFAVQSWQIGEDPIAAQLDTLDRFGPNVRLVRGARGPVAYADMIRETDIVLLAYDPRRYRDRGSGVFVEAAASGRVLVGPEGSWITREARAHGLSIIAFDRFDERSIAQAVIEATDRRDELLRNAETASSSWRLQRSPAAFLDAVTASCRRVSLKTRQKEHSSSSIPTRRANSELRSADPLAGCTDDDTLYTDAGMWTPQTAMLRALHRWVIHSDHEPSTALSIDRNTALDDMFRLRWPSIDIEVAQYPDHDVQRLDAFPSDAFDLVYSHQVLEHVPKPWLAAKELVRVLKPGGIGLHTTCAHNPRHGLPAFNDYYRFLPDGLEQLFDDVETLIKDGWGNRQALAYNLVIDDGYGQLGGRRFPSAVGQANDPNFPWHTWIIFRKTAQ